MINSFFFTEVAAYREELDGIKIVGKKCPRPIKTWSQCITSDKILQRLNKYFIQYSTDIDETTNRLYPFDLDMNMKNQPLFKLKHCQLFYRGKI